MKNCNNLFFFFLLCFIQNIKAQDPVHSQFYYNRLELNPAFAGVDGPGKFRLNLFHRNLYRPIKGPFNSSNFSADYSLCNANIGLGMIASNENQGDGFLQTNKIEGIINVMLGSRFSNFSAGIKVGGLFQNVDWSKYTFSDQYDPIFGNVRPSTNSNIVSDFTSTVNLGFGLNFTTWNRKNNKALNLGLSGNNLNDPNLGYLNQYILPKRFTVYGAIIFQKYKWSNDKSGRVFFRFDKQNSFFTTLILGEFYFNNILNIGSGFRVSGINNTNSYIISVGIQPSKVVKIITSYEVSIGGFNLIGAGNTFELGIIWVPEKQICSFGSFLNIFRGKRNGGGVKKLDCPVISNDVIKPF
jgi:type IX secretion system PorP/SprF family membrane protein